MVAAVGMPAPMITPVLLSPLKLEDPGTLVSWVVELLETHQRKFLEDMQLELAKALESQGCSHAGASVEKLKLGSESGIASQFLEPRCSTPTGAGISARLTGHSTTRLDGAVKSPDDIVLAIDSGDEDDVKGCSEDALQGGASCSKIWCGATSSPTTEAPSGNGEAPAGSLSSPMRSLGIARRFRARRRAPKPPVPPPSQKRARDSERSEVDEIYAHMQMHQAAVLEHSCNSFAGRLVQAPAFECAVCALVAMNAASIGIHTNWSMKNLDDWDKEPSLFRIVDLVFSAAFLLELVLRIIGEGWHFWARANRNLPWNMLDFVLVLSVLLEELLALFLLSAPNVTVMRLLRTLRMVRVVRLFRVTRFSTDLRLMVMGIFCAMRSLFWLIVLLFIVMYMFAVCIMQITADSLVSNAAGKGPSETRSLELLQYVGSLEATMYILYKSVCGGLEWGDVADELGRQEKLLAVLYAMYISFTTLCILNIVTGVFVQNASTIAQHDQLETKLEHLERRRERQKEVLKLFNNLGEVDEEGRIGWKSFKRCVTNPSVQTCFTKLGLDLEHVNARGLFCLFDGNDDGKVDLQEFAHGIEKLHGHARNFDLHLLRNDAKRILATVGGERCFSPDECSVALGSKDTVPTGQAQPQGAQGRQRLDGVHVHLGAFLGRYA